MYPILDDESNYIDLGNNSFISVDNFENRFGIKDEHKFSYDYFINHENTTDGWKIIFDEWKDKGILN